ncbi:MAG: DUF2202 domain-containing protein [Candidatus Peribacteria bacterium]|nr:MAG: DUF2202 domain-containing protein [Candidatus Peribacteria bacterium]
MYQDQSFTDLYEQLTKQGQTSLADALTV